MWQQEIQIESLVVYGWPGIVCHKQEPNRLPGTDCAYIPRGHLNAIWNKEVWRTSHGERKIASHITDGIRLSDGQHVKDIDGTGYTYLGILQNDKI